MKQALYPVERVLKSLFRLLNRTQECDCMPGSPYLNENPPGLLTWPKLLAITVPTLLALSAIAWWQDLLIEWAITLTVLLILTFYYRR